MPSCWALGERELWLWCAAVLVLPAAGWAARVWPGAAPRAEVRVATPEHLAARPASDPVGSPVRLDLNSATAEELNLLPGIGPARARQIVRWREEHGPFGSLQDLTQLRGFTPALRERIEPYLTVTSDPSER